MKAYLSADMKEVAGLTHPGTINAFNNTFTQELERAIQRGSEKKFLAQGGSRVDHRLNTPEDYY